MSVGGCSRARSQGDLYHPGTPHYVTRGRGCPPGTYATTAEMRRNASVPGHYGGFVGYPRLQHAGGSQLTLPDIWATATPCPVHGTYGRRHPVHHIYDMPLLDAEDAAAMPAQGDVGNPMSPFYHELDVASVGLDSIPTPPPRPDGPSAAGDSDSNSAPFSKI